MNNEEDNDDDDDYEDDDDEDDEDDDEYDDDDDYEDDDDEDDDYDMDDDDDEDDYDMDDDDDEDDYDVDEDDEEDYYDGDDDDDDDDYDYDADAIRANGGGGSNSDTAMIIPPDNNNNSPSVPIPQPVKSFGGNDVVVTKESSKASLSEEIKFGLIGGGIAFVLISIIGVCVYKCRRSKARGAPTAEEKSSLNLKDPQLTGDSFHDEPPIINDNPGHGFTDELPSPTEP